MDKNANVTKATFILFRLSTAKLLIKVERALFKYLVFIQVHSQEFLRCSCQRTKSIKEFVNAQHLDTITEIHAHIEHFLVFVQIQRRNVQYIFYKTIVCELST